MWGIQGPYALSYPKALDVINDTDKEIKVEEYLENNLHLERFVTTLFRATIPVYDGGNHFNGIGLAIAKDLVLVSKYCINGEEGNLDKFGIGKVIFDGTYSEEKLNFIILQVKDVTFSPATLDIAVPNVRESIQMHFKPTISYPYQLETYVKPLKPNDNKYIVIQPDQGFSRANPEEYGAPKMSLTNGYVYAIHQGENEELEMSNIYLNLKQASDNNSHPQNKDAHYILANIQLANLGISTMSECCGDCLFSALPLLLCSAI